MKTFEAMGLPATLTQTLKHIKFNTPTPIQAEAIPPALQGRDILGSAQTGTGKTAAFAIPLISKLLLDPKSSALVMTPTRELATQVINQLKIMLGRKSNIRTALLIGGESMPKQLSQLRHRPQVVVGTPGRINDHLKRRSLMLDKTSFLVLDETDRMLDMGFTDQVEDVIQHMAADRQTLLFSATLPKNIVRIAGKYLNDPVHIAVNPTSTPAANIKQDLLRISEHEKYPSLTAQLNERKGSIIVFVKTKHGTEKMAKRLSKEGHSANAIHGDLRQNKRDRVIAAFRNKKYRILVATDVAARGLDIPHIEHVINYDLPQCAEDYIHRIGRTARAGAEGCALNLITPADNGKWRAIDRLLNPDARRSQPRPDNKNKGRRFKNGKKNDTASQRHKYKSSKRSPAKRNNQKKAA